MGLENLRVEILQKITDSQKTLGIRKNIGIRIKNTRTTIRLSKAKEKPKPISESKEKLEVREFYGLSTNLSKVLKSEVENYCGGNLTNNFQNWTLITKDPWI